MRIKVIFQNKANKILNILIEKKNVACNAEKAGQRFNNFRQVNVFPRN